MQWNKIAVGDQSYLRFSSQNRVDDKSRSDLGTPQKDFAPGLNWTLASSVDGKGLGSAVDSTECGQSV